MPSTIWRGALFLLAFFLCTGAQFRTTNFLVESPDPAISQQIAQYAEYWRKVKALEWIGQEMPTWPEPCPIHVKITLGGSGGATSFIFDQGRVLGIDMQIEGTLDRILASVLPHEITHTVFAHQFRRPLPRWADEGGCVLSEDDLERQRHDQMVREILNTPNRKMPLRRLFALTEYPDDVMVLYAQGFSVSEFLVQKANRQVFLGFLGTAMQYGWDHALRTHYGFPSTESLEDAWLLSLRQTKKPAPVLAGTPGPGTNPFTGKSANALVSQAKPTTAINSLAMNPRTNNPAMGSPVSYPKVNPEGVESGPDSKQTISGIRLGPPRFSNGKQANPVSLNPN
ncbi:MAG: hypothetical protein ACKOS8_01440 [Gemmataceae bacterium]